MEVRDAIRLCAKNDRVNDHNAVKLAELVTRGGEKGKVSCLVAGHGHPDSETRMLLLPAADDIACVLAIILRSVLLPIVDGVQSNVLGFGIANNT